MKKVSYVFALLISFIINTNAQLVVPDEIAPYVNFLKQQKLTAKDYLLSLFDRYDIVVFSERIHDELTQYAAVLSSQLRTTQLIVSLFSFYPGTADGVLKQLYILIACI